MQDASVVRTEKLYERDAYCTRFDATVLKAGETPKKGGGNLLDVVLDRTCFFPEEGGQSPDRGVLAGLAVSDVQIRDGEIHHFLEMPRTDCADAVPHPGTAVHGEIDWEERFSNMQQHSGEHLVSGIVHRKYGFENVGFHLGSGEVTLDFNGVIPKEDLPEIEQEANKAVFANLPSEICITTPKEREEMNYRSKLDLDNEVRIVTFPGVDSCACCAPHVHATGEIGLIKITGMIRWKGGVRVSILCGKRALAYFQNLQEIVQKTAGFLTTSAENLYPQAVRMKEEIRELSAKVQEAEARDLIRIARELPRETEHAVIVTKTAAAASMREAVNSMMEIHAGYCGVFAGSDEEGYQFVAGSRTLDARDLCRILKERFGARGGGKPEMVQGSVQAPAAELTDLFRH